MEKLIKLLNESEDWFVSKFVSYDDINWVFRLDNWQSFHYTLILSKEYSFIKRLVEHDKIDFDNRELKDKFMEEFERYPTFNSNTYKRDFNINGLLMLLSIQDNPIEFLVSILK